MSSSTDDIFVAAISQKTAEEVEDEALTRTISGDLNGLIRLLRGVHAELFKNRVHRLSPELESWYQTWAYVQKNRYLLEKRQARANGNASNSVAGISDANHRGAGITVGSVSETFFVVKEPHRMVLPPNASGSGVLNGFAPYKLETRTMQPLCMIPEKLQVGDVVVIRRFDPESTIPLYIRQPWVEKLNEMKEEFESNRNLRLYFKGPTGCGKTCFFWMWAIMKMQQGKRVLFLQYHVDEPSIWMLEDQMLKSLVISPKLNGANLLQVVEQLLSQQTREFDYCVLDGVRMDICKNLVDKLRSATRKKTILKVVFVTSFHFHLRHSDEPLGIYLNRHWKMSFDSWNESDYDQVAGSGMLRDESTRKRLLHDGKLLTNNDAVHNSNDRDDDDDDDEKVKQAVKLKYFYAGGSARFMFEFDLLQLKKQLSKWMEEVNRCDGWNTLACNTLAGKDETVSVNSLMQRFTHEPYLSFTKYLSHVPVSEFVLRHAYTYCRDKLTDSVKSAGHCTNNPTWLRWAAELAELDKADLAFGSNKANGENMSLSM
jgi:hypothetical protein